MPNKDKQSQNMDRYAETMAAHIKAQGEIGVTGSWASGEPIPGTEADIRSAALTDQNDIGSVEFFRKLTLCKIADTMSEDVKFADYVASLFDRKVQGAAPTEQLIFDDYPEYNTTAMGCGLEDQNITDRYDAMRHGWDEAMKRVGERISNFLSRLAQSGESSERAPVGSIGDDMEFGELLIGWVARPTGEKYEALIAYITNFFASAPAKLTDEQIREISLKYRNANGTLLFDLGFARAIESALTQPGEKHEH
jgi:hypothetical protein